VKNRNNHVPPAQRSAGRGVPGRILSSADAMILPISSR
jgi:hypothetical protein